MSNTVSQDRSNAYEQVAETFVRVRSGVIGAKTVQEWSRTLPPGSSILDLGCGHGVPISQTLINDGFILFGVDASAKMIAAFRDRFPHAQTECSAVEDSEFFGRTFDGVIAWGLMFLLLPEIQPILIAKVARALRVGGRFLFTAPQQAVTWSDALTGRESISLGIEAYRRILCAEGLALVGEQCDEGDNHYYFTVKV